MSKQFNAVWRALKLVTRHSSIGVFDMGRLFRRAVLVFLYSLLLSVAFAADIHWTNTAGGNWNAAANWQPNTVPSATDNAFIVAAGTYTVTLNVSATVSNLTVGGTSGTQTLSNNATDLTIRLRGSIGTNGVFVFGSGTWTGTNIVEGKWEWSGGTLAGVCSVTTGAVVNLKGSATKTLSGTVTNNGAFNIIGSGSFSLGSSKFYNVTGSLFHLQTNQTVDAFANAEFINVGTILKSAGDGNSIFNVSLRNTGAVEIQSGSIDFNRGGTLDGTFVDAGKGINFTTGVCIFDAMPNFTGSVQFGVGATLYFTVPISNFTLSSGTLAGTNTIIGVLNWTGGTLGSVCTVTTGAVVNINGAAGKSFSGTITNFGTFNVAGSGTISGLWIFYNQPGGLFDIQSDLTITGQGGTELVNAGIFRKSAGAGTAFFRNTLRNSATVELTSGTLEFTYKGNLGGAFTAAPGTTVLFSQGDYVFDAMPNFMGNVQFGVNAFLYFTVPITDFTLTGGQLVGTNVVTGILNLTGGYLGGVCTVVTGAVVNVSGSTAKGFDGTITNFGTFVITGTGTISGLPWHFYNQPGALFDIRTNVVITGQGGAEFVNSGTFRRSAGADVASFRVTFRNLATVEVNTGTLDFTAGGYLGGTFTVAPGATNLFSTGNCIFNAMPNFTGNVQYGVNAFLYFTVPITDFTLTGGSLAGTNTVTGILNWTGGYLGGVCTVTTGAVVNVSGGADKSWRAVVVTNYGTFTLTATGAIGGLAWFFYNQPGALFDIQSNVEITGFGNARFFNAGTFRKSAGAGTAFWRVSLQNSGLVEVTSGTMDFTAGGTLDGTFTAAPGTTNLFSTGDCIFNAMPNFTGSIQFGVNAFLYFTVPITDFTLTGGQLAGTNLVVGILNWTGGYLGGVCTVTTGAVVNVSGGADKSWRAVIVTNYGTFTVTATGAIGGLAWFFYNQAGALFDIQSTIEITGFGNARFFNAGIFRKSAGTGTAIWRVSLQNSGLVEVTSGAVDFTGGGNFGGNFTVSSGATILFSQGDCVFDATPNLAGNVQFGVNAFLYFTAPITNFTLYGGRLAGTNVVSGTLNWIGGRIDDRLSIQPAGTVNVLGDCTFGNGFFTNFGTMNLFSNISGLSWRFYNKPGALFDIRAAVSIRGFGDAQIFNSGTVRHSIPFETSSCFVELNNSEILDLVGGRLVFSVLDLSASSMMRFVSVQKGNSVSQFGSIGLGKCVLNGSAEIIVTNGVPTEGDVFQLISGGASGGGFSQISGLDLGGGLFFQAICDATGMRLVTRSANSFPPPSSTNLVNQIAGLGRSASFCITPLGAEPFAYSWRSNGVVLSAETNACLIITNVTTTSAGTYCVLVTDAQNATNLYCATLTVLTPVSILTQPTNRTIFPATNVTLSVIATGSPPLQYQWRLNGANIPGATSNSYTINNAQPRDGGNYSVVVGNPVGTVSSSFALLVVTTNYLPFADNFAARGTIVGRSGVGLGTNIFATNETFEPKHAGKTGGHSIWLQWTAPTNGVAVFNTRGSSFDTLLAIYAGTSLATLSNLVSDEDRGGFFTSETIFSAQAGSNYLIAVDGFFGETGQVVLTWNLDTNVTAVPRILQQPLGVTAAPGGSAMFDVLAVGTNITYQWFFNCCLKIPDATNATLLLTNVSPLDIGYYTVEVTSANGFGARSIEAPLELGPNGTGQTEDKLENLITSGGSGLVGKGATKSWFSVSAGTVTSRNIEMENSSNQARETNHCGLIGGVSRWLALEPLTNGTMTIDTIGSTLDTVLAVYKGDNNLNLQFVACDNNSAPDGFRSVVRFPATTGMVYKVAVDTVGGVPGIIQVNWAVGAPPILNVTPTNFSAAAGGTVTFTVSPTNSASPPPTYQWYLNQMRIFGATNQLFSLTNLSSRQGGRYSVIVSNFIGSFTSLVATVNVPRLFVLNGFATNVSGAFQFHLNGSASEAAELQGTTTLTNWETLFTNQVPNSPFTFSDMSVSNLPARFYRLRSTQ